MLVALHKWAVGTTSQWTFNFRMLTNPFYEPKTKQKSQEDTESDSKTPRKARHHPIDDHSA